MEMIMDNQELIEFVGTGLTTGDKEELNLRGFGTVYTSETYKNKTKNMIRKFAPSYSITILESMIDRGMVVPISLSKNLFNYLKKRKEIKNEQTSGFYRPSDEKIYLLWEPLNRSKIKSAIVWVLFHEAMHMAAAFNPKAFFNANKVPLLKFYFYIYSKFFKTDKKYNREVMLLVSKWVENSLILIEKSGSGRPNIKHLTNFLDAFDKYSTLDSKERDRKQDLVWDAWVDYYNKSTTTKESDELFEYFDEAYSKMFKMMDAGYEGTVEEEILLPSAVISKLASNNPNLQYVKKSLRIIV